ncbi:rubrerythrin family protein [Thermodesulfovibrio thiophilus]|uniref:rubrerythrin family protein n=1 Tax=Thermodesulfovibrio thiophilus TaxID=340095 RepID=UPI0017EAAF00|nr:rubrerythrin family protein [Thermodesulfovibrio thiophilus]HHW21075.1 rubrerythrin family protein [Thermodesulfovibrio thiophilus]
MREMTKRFLYDAFAGESMAHMKYTIFAEEAEKKGLSKLANLFRAIAYAEYIHARNHYKELGLLKDMSNNVQQCIDGENFEIEEMYPVYNNTAQLQNEKGAERSTKFALEAEKIHAEMYKKAKTLVDKNEDYPAEKVYICPVCGHTIENEPPEKCPVCGAPKSAYKEFSV